MPPGRAGWRAGTYHWDATYSGDTNNSSVQDNNDPAELVTVTAAGEFAFGAGWYTPSPSVGQTSFGFVVVPGPKSTYAGQLNVVTANRWWYQGNVASYGKTSKSQGLLAGTGSLYSWNAALNNGHGWHEQHRLVRHRHQLHRQRAAELLHTHHPDQGRDHHHLTGRRSHSRPHSACWTVPRGELGPPTARMRSSAACRPMAGRPELRDLRLSPLVPIAE